MAKTNDGKRLANGTVAALLAIFLFVIVGAVLWDFMNAFFIAIIGYVFLNPTYLFLRRRGIGKTVSAWATLIFGLIAIGIPCFFILQMVAKEFIWLLQPSTLSAITAQITSALDKIGGFFPGFDPTTLEPEIGALTLQAANFLKSIVVGSISGIGKLALGMLVILFSFYYLLTAEDALGSARNFIPLSKKNTDIFIREFLMITDSVIITTIWMALLQAVPITMAFIYFGVPGAAILGLIAAILTCIPFTGIPFVWVPVAAMQALNGNMPAAAGITAVGIGIAILENFRPVVQGKVSAMHPLVSLLGVIVGVPYFGIMGVLIGPILVSYALLSARMFKEEYL